MTPRPIALPPFLRALLALSRWLVGGAFAVLASPALALGEAPWVGFEPRAGGFELAGGGRAVGIVVDPADHAGVLRAAGDLQRDIARVSGVEPALLRQPRASAAVDLVIVGTLGQSALIDALVAAGALDAAALRGRWEAFVVQLLERPLPGVGRALVIAGSDKRGTIYGLYTLSEQIGVSPWAWWADVPVQRRERLVVAAGTRVADAPVVRWRGIFINDEAPALAGWVHQFYGGWNHRFYERVFELILRLRGNLLWPAMWGSAFYDDDPKNGALADAYGIVMGTSHHEPMMRAQQEWRRHGGGPWDYERNGERLRRFWAGGLEQTRDYEKVITVGMRGDGDEPMSEAANVALLERIVDDQRALIGRTHGRPASEVPQVWTLYKEVQEYYERGMRVPDDVLLLWADDNWGNIRRLPTPEERARRGGAGVYYHFDYVGGPRSYKWINTIPIAKIWEQMHLAWQHGANAMWITNVGDLKPMEVPTEFFLRYAWNPAAWPAGRLREYLQLWAAREFGPAHAVEIADLVATYTKYNGRRKPEMLDGGTYSLLHYREAERVVADWNALAARAERIGALLPAAYRDAYFQLVLYPVKACAVVNELHVTAGLNRLHGQQGRVGTNALAERVRALFRQDAELTRQFHEEIAGGKWNHMMSQPRIGYSSWNQPPRNLMPAVSEVQPSKAAEMGVAVEGSDRVGPGGAALVLPPLDAFERRPRWIELFNRGAAPFDFEITASEPWVRLSQRRGSVGQELRVMVDADWDAAPIGRHQATLTIAGPGSRRATVVVPLHREAVLRGDALRAYAETAGVVAVEAEDHTAAIAPAGREWLRIPDHGRTVSAMTPLPVDAPPLAPEAAGGMRLEYRLDLVTTGRVQVHTTLAPTQAFRPGRGLRFAVSLGDQPPQVVDMHADTSLRAWERSVADGAVTFVTHHQVATPGMQTLKFWVIDSGVVLQRLVVDAGGLRPSYLGPPRSPLFPQAAARRD